MNAKLLKLARIVLKFETTMVGEMEWIHEGPLAVGAEVYVTDEAGELVAVADGEYMLEDKKIVIAEGKVVEMEVEEPEIAPEPEPEPDAEEEMKKKCKMEGEEPEVEAPAEPEIAPEPEVDERDIKIAELEAKIAELSVLVEEKDAKIAELEAKIVLPVEEPIEMSATPREKSQKQSGAMKFFEK